MPDIKTDALETVLTRFKVSQACAADEAADIAIINAALAELSALRARVERGEADSKRLDFVLANAEACEPTFYSPRASLLFGYSIPMASADQDKRDAIDAAMTLPESSHA